MNESVSLPAETPQAFSRRTLLYAAWALVLLLTIPEIVLRGFMQLDTSWMTTLRIAALGAFAALTYVWPALRPLRGLALVFLVVYAVEALFFLTFLPQTELYASIFGGDPNTAFFGERLMRIGASLVMLVVLIGMGLKRRDFFLTVGNLKAVAEPERWGIPRKPETWPGFSLRFALIVSALLLLFIVPSLQPSLDNLSVGLVLFAALCAVMNAFAEEFLYRSALLPQVLPIFGKGAAIFLVAGWFGLGHYFGMPYGISGVLFAGFGGWVFAKAMVETRGMGWPLFLHFVGDFTIYVVMLLAAAV